MAADFIQKWEYLSQLMYADSDQNRDQLKKRFPNEKIGRYSPRALIPDLNQLGEQGWELIHMEPVAGVGGNADIWWQGGAVPTYSNAFFCVFKRKTN